MENHNFTQSSFSNEDVKKTLSWTEILVSKTGTRLTGTIGCRKAFEIIYHKLKEVCHLLITDYCQYIVCQFSDS